MALMTKEQKEIAIESVSETAYCLYRSMGFNHIESCERANIQPDENGKYPNLLHKDYIRDKIVEIREDQAANAGVQPERLMAEMMALCLSDVGDLYDEEGNLIQNISQLPDRVRKAIKSVEFATDKDTGVKTLTKVTFYDKNMALSRAESLIKELFKQAALRKNAKQTKQTRVVRGSPGKPAETT